MIHDVKHLAMFLGLLLGVAGCGYRLGSATSPPAGITTVAIPSFINRSYEPGIEGAFTDAARSELLRRGVVKVVASDADAELHGEVLSFEARPSALRAIEGGGGKSIPARYRTHVVVRVTLVVPETGEILWEDQLSADAAFDASGAEGFEGITRKANQDTVLRQIATDIMREAAERMLADF